MFYLLFTLQNCSVHWGIYIFLAFEKILFLIVFNVEKRSEFCVFHFRFLTPFKKRLCAFEMIKKNFLRQLNCVFIFFPDNLAVRLVFYYLFH